MTHSSFQYSAAWRIPAVLFVALLMLSSSALWSASQASVPIRIGVLVGGSPDLASGVSVLLARMIAESKVSSAKVSVLPSSAACHGAALSKAAKKIVAQKVAFVVVLGCPKFGGFVAQIFDHAQVIAFFADNDVPALTDHGGFSTFRLSGRSDLEGRVLGRLLANTYAGRRVALVHDGSRSLRALALAVRSEIRSFGLAEKLFLQLDLSEKSSPAAQQILREKLKAKKIGVVFLALPAPHFLSTIKAIERAGLTPQIIAPRQAGSLDFAKNAGDTADGILFAAPLAPADLPEALAFQKGLPIYERNLGRPALAIYAALQAWVQASITSGANPYDTEKISRALREIKLKTVLGTFNFDIKGDPTLPPFGIYQWLEGHKRYVPAPADKSCPQAPGELLKLNPSNI